MKKNKTLVFAVAVVSMLLCVVAYDAADHVWTEDAYELNMRIHVPRIYDNSQSLGRRKYQMQLVSCDIFLQYNIYGNFIGARFTNAVNKTHRMSNGKNVTYDILLDSDKQWPKFNAIGSNKTKVFKTASVCFAIAAEPSYNIGEFDEDNALYVMLAGKGTFYSKQKMLKSCNGYLVGTIGCGCMAYGHVSPTRKIGYYGPTDQVDDVAAVYGTWRMKCKKASTR